MPTGPPAEKPPVRPLKNQPHLHPGHFSTVTERAGQRSDIAVVSYWFYFVTRCHPLTQGPVKSEAATSPAVLESAKFRADEGYVNRIFAK